MRAKRQPRHACEIERLEERQLLVAGIALTAGILSIEGTDQADQISMEGTNGGAGVLATIRSASNTILLQRSYEARLVSSYSVHGMGGDDTIRNLTGLIGTMYGDANNDRLIGGSGAETLYGGDGDDQLWGGAGADDLYGGN